METVNAFQLEPSHEFEKESGPGRKQSNAIKQKSNRRIVSKVTKLTLKPKPKLITSKNPSKTSQITTKKYAGIKPVTIKSRSTLISHESTYCIKNIPRKTPTTKQRQNAENASHQQRNNSFAKHTSDQPTNSNPKPQNKVMKIDSIWNSPKQTQILQEITSAVVNQSSVSSVKDPIVPNRSDSVDESVLNGHRNSNENSTRCKLKETIASAKAKEEKGPVSREEIKRRLSVLRKNSLKIVENNVRKAKRCSSIVTTNKEQVIRKTAEPGCPAKNESKTTPKTSQPRRKSSQTPVTPSKFIPTIKTNKNRIGILRRPEGISPTLHSTEQNQSASVQTPSTNKSNPFLHTPSPQAAIDYIATDWREPLELSNIKLKVPEIVNRNENLKCSFTRSKQLHSGGNEKSHGGAVAGAGADAMSDKNDSIPYWLRPTPVQPYPYNFILAVRKKLESITNPVMRAKGTRTTTTQKSSPPIAETFFDLLSKVPSMPNPPQPQQTIEALTNNDSIGSAMIIQRSVVEPVWPEPINSINVSNQMKSPLNVHLSAMHNSNVSNNNVSRHIELKSNDNGAQDTLSISSGILTSHSSPEKKLLKLNVDKTRPITPLATDAIDGMTIFKRNANQSNVSERESIQNQMHISSHINFERGNSFDERSQLTFNDLSRRIVTETTSNGGNGTRTRDQNDDVHKLLKDFNDSLSQVIKVNQYLHGILSHSPTNRKKDETPASAKDSTEYSNDFEEEAMTTEQRSIEENIESDTQQSHNKRDTERVEQVDDIGHSNSNNETNSNVRTLFDEPAHKSSIRTEVDNASSEIADNENGSSIDSPTENDFKSISLSIAKKSTATEANEDKTNATESFQKHIVSEPDVLNQSIGSDIFIMFNKTSMGLDDELNSSAWSMHSLSYSSLGVCDQLLKSEVRKSEDLASLLKIRERALIDRFKGQIAWLELHKQKFKKAGRIAEISMIKKKQRALLLRLNHDRKELHRIIREKQQKSHKTPLNELNVNYNISHMNTNMSIRRKSVNQQQLENTSSKQAVKALELPGGGQALEFALQRRENELRRRRKHVEKLLNWHQRLDIEEQQVMKLEQMLMFVSSSHAYRPSSSMREHRQDYEHSHRLVLVSQHDQPKSKSNNTSQFSVEQQLNDLSLDKSQIEYTKQKQINKIEKSLNTLKSISGRSVSSNIDGSDSGLTDDVVEILGRQLNKLWRRLTGQCDEEFAPDRVYRLTKSKLESLYERAKSVVLNNFDSNDEFKIRLIEGSMSIVERDDGGDTEEQQCNSSNGFDAETNETKTIVPELNLTSLLEQQSIDVKANSADRDQGYYFSSNECVNKSVRASGSGCVETDLDAERHNDNALNATHDSEDLQSDITADSLNQDAGNGTASKSNESQENIRTQTIENDTKENSSPMEKSPAIPTITVNGPRNEFQLIADTSFANIDMPANASSSSLILTEDVSIEANTIQSPDNDNLYESEKFEEIPPTESIETNDSSKIDEQITAESNNSSKTVPNTNGKLSQSNDEPMQTQQSIHDQQSNEEFTVKEKTIRISEENDETTPSANVQSDSSSDNATTENDGSESAAKSESDLSPTKQRQYQYSLISNGSIDHNQVLEADALKRTLPIGTDTAPKSPDQSTVFPFLREIPNKPPPPYPAHRQLPKLPPFPTSDRIKDIVYERIEQLYRESNIEPQLLQTPITPSTSSTNNLTISINSNDAILSSPLTPATPHPIDATFVCSPSNLSPTLTPTISNVHERIIRDCCDEIMEDLKKDTNAFRAPLAFYNPPNRLLCYQMYALKRIYKILNRPCDGRHDDCNDSTLLQPLMARLSTSNRRKRDAVDEILIQELYEDDSKWTNFTLEEEEIRRNFGDDLTKLLLLVDESLEVHDQSNSEDL